MSNVKTMLMTEALRERKLLRDRFQNSLQGVFVGVVKGDDKKPRVASYRTVEELESKITSSRQSTESLLTNYRSLVAAIVKSNADTTVKVNGKDMTVAAAIEMRNSIGMERSYLNILRRQIDESIAAVVAEQRTLDADIDRRVTNMKTEAMSAQDITDLLETTKKRFYAEMAPEFFDPTNAKTRLAELDAQLSDFDAALETALNISNATTSIEVEYV